MARVGFWPVRFRLAQVHFNMSGRKCISDDRTSVEREKRGAAKAKGRWLFKNGEEDEEARQGEGEDGAEDGQGRGEEGAQGEQEERLPGGRHRRHPRNRSSPTQTLVLSSLDSFLFFLVLWSFRLSFPRFTFCCRKTYRRRRPRRRKSTSRRTSPLLLPGPVVR